MRSLATVFVLATAAPAAASPMLVVGFDARLATSLARALEHEGGEIVAQTSVPPRASGTELAERVEELVLTHAPELVVVVGKTDYIGQTRLLVTDARGQVIGRLDVEKRDLTSKKRVRTIARKLLRGVEFAEAQPSRYAPINVAGAYPAFAVPENAPWR